SIVESFKGGCQTYVKSSWKVAVQGIGDTAWIVLYVDNDEIVAREAGDLGESGGEVEEEEVVHVFAPSPLLQKAYSLFFIFFFYFLIFYN
ncbi:LOW QUALITY PROTEIN: hypothetical protein TorRG33x02_170340, partial [Trema orientale]